MLTILLRKTLLVLGLMLLLTAASGAVANAAPPLAPALQIDEDGGVLISSVRADSPADKAGIVDGDIVLAVDDEAVEDARTLAMAILAREMGDEVLLTLLRDGQTVEASVILGERNGRTYLGVQLEAEAAIETEEEAEDGESQSLEESFQDILPMDSIGAIVGEVVEDGPADAAGLAAGDLILAVDGVEVSPENDLAELIGAFEPGDEITLEVRGADAGENESSEVVVTLGAHPQDEGKAFLGLSYMPASMMFGRFGQLPRGERLPIPREAAPEQDEEAEDEAVEEEASEEEASEEDAEAGSEGSQPDALAMTELGAIVTDVVEGGPADEAGLEAGDVITAVDGEAVSPDADLAILIGAFAPGDEITLEVRSADAEENESSEVVVTLGAHPDDEERAFLGVAYMPANAMFDRMRPRLPLLPRGVQPMPEQDEEKSYPYHHRHHRHGHGDTQHQCPYHDEDYDGHHGHGRYHGQGHHGMMMPFFDFDMDGEGFEGFDLDQLSEEDLEMLKEILPFLFPELEVEPEGDGGV